jgi:hypothetical protein
VSGAIAQGPPLTGRDEAAAARRALEGPPKGGAAPQSSPQAEAEAEAKAAVLCDPMGHGGSGGRVHELRCAVGSHAVGAFGSYGLVLNSLVTLILTLTLLLTLTLTLILTLTLTRCSIASA